MNANGRSARAKVQRQGHHQQVVHRSSRKGSAQCLSPGTNHKSPPTWQNPLRPSYVPNATCPPVHAAPRMPGDSPHFVRGKRTVPFTRHKPQSHPHGKTSCALNTCLMPGGHGKPGRAHPHHRVPARTPQSATDRSATTTRRRSSPVIHSHHVTHDKEKARYDQISESDKVRFLNFSSQNREAELVLERLCRYVIHESLVRRELRKPRRLGTIDVIQCQSVSDDLQQ